MQSMSKQAAGGQNSFGDFRKSVGDSMVNAQVAAFVNTKESFEVVQNYMDAAVGVLNQTGQGKLVQTINDPITSPFAFPNPLADFAEGVKNAVAGTNLRAPTPTLDGHNFFDLPGVTIDGKKVRKMGDMCKGKKATLIVNVASNCALTTQNYEGLVKLYDEYRKLGLEIIAYPCNQFFCQEPGTLQEIKQFQKDLGVKFPVMQKVDVNGDGSDPVFEYLRGQSDLKSNEIPMNFSKFLVDKNGDCVAFYNPQRNPQTLKNDIDTLLGYV